MMNWIAPVLLSSLLLGFGCGGDSSSEAIDTPLSPEESADPVLGSEASAGLIDEFDAATIPDAPFDMILGTGRETYVPIVDGETLFLELGHQGLQHVLVSVRLFGLPQDRYFVDFQLVRNDGVTVSEPAYVRVPFNDMADGSGAELLGYTLVVADPELAVSHDAVLRVAVEGPEGGIVMDEREVHVEWAPEDWNPDA